VDLQGWSRGGISLAYSLAFVAGLPAVLAVGWLADRFGVRRLIQLGSLSLITGMLLLAGVSQLWQFYIYYSLLIGGLGSVVFTVLLPVTITRWFIRRVGLAVGLLWASLGLGPVVFAPLFRWLIENRGWQPAFYIMGIAVGGIVLLGSLLIHGRPQDKGMAPYGAEETGEARQEKAPAAVPGVRLQAVLGRGSIWNLAAIHHLGCVGHAIILAHVVSMATYQGVPGVTAAGILSVISGTSIASRFVFSILTERLGGRRVLTIALLAQSTPVLMLLWAREPWAFYLFAVIFGLGYGGEMVGFPIINRQLYGAEAPLHSIYSFQMVGASLGMALGGWLGGALFDLTGTYVWSILASAGAGYLALPSILSLPRHRRPRGPELPTQIGVR